MYVLGINCYYHDSAACLIKDGKVIAAAEEERFTREKHTPKFPVHAIDYCLRQAEISFSEIGHIGFFWNPWIRLRKGMSILLRYFPKSIAAFKDTSTGLNMIRVKNEIKNNFKTSKFKFYYIEHHLAHAASCFFASPFREAAILSIDGTGESTTTLLAIGKENKIKVLERIKFPHSIGLVYNAVTEFLGFKRDSDEWKVMGLAPYGKPSYCNEFKKIIKLKPSGNFKLDLSYFKFQYGGEPYYSKKFIEVFGQPRKESDPIEKRHEDIANSLQLVTEEAILHIANYLQKITGQKKLCLAGGVALNSVANGRIITETRFKDIFVQPAANDAGTSLGSALYIYNQILKKPRNYIMHDAYLGPEYTEREIEVELKRSNLDYIRSNDIAKDAAKLLSEGKIVGWFQGRMEFGPRALGSRSILADPRKAEMKDIINAKVKYRECYDGQTQILTKNGWKLFKDVIKNEEVATLNPKTNELVYQRIKRKTEYKYSGKMVCFKNKRISLVVTPEHNVWAKKITNHSHSIYKNQFGFEKAINLVGQENIQIKAINEWRGQEKKYFILPKITRKKYSHIDQIDRIPMNLWLEFLGYYLSEGSFCYDKGHHNIYISQHINSKYYKKIKKCLNNIYKWRYNSSSRSFILSNKQLFEYLKQFGKAKDKFIPQEFLELSEKQLEILFDALMRGDGTYRPKQYKYATTSKKLADNVQELGLKLGYSVTTSKEVSNNPKHNNIYYVRLNKGSKISYVRKNQSSLINYHGKVYCVTVPKYNILCIKRDEKIVFSGNSFRPFAPSVLEDYTSEYFEHDYQSPFMLLVYKIKKDKQKLIPAVTHVDGTGRLQTVSKKVNPLYWNLIDGFRKLTNIPVILNTSFNIKGEPIVCSPKDAINCFRNTGIDCLAIGPFLVKQKS
ncbi:MAG: carbamoyltransferase C-terminal domain-containing protein [Nanoarchaeota archaeon]